MNYYKVKKTADQTKYSKRGDFLIGGELYTPAEYKKAKAEYALISRRFFEEYFEIVNIKKTDIYFCFGVRFA